MGTAERRLEILKYLCRARKATMPQLAQMFGVSIRTIQRDILEIGSFIPLDTRAGRYDGGIYVFNEYRMDRMYMSNSEIHLLHKIKAAIDASELICLNDDEDRILNNLIKTYQNPSR